MVETSNRIEVTPPSRHADAWERLLVDRPSLHPGDVCPGPAARPVVAVVAHPDDETLAMGGLLASLHAAGTPVHVVALTRGEAALTHLGLDEPGLAERRDTELLRACSALGASVLRVGSWPDGRLGDHAGEAAAAVVDALTGLAPRAVVTLSALDPHPDHRAAGAVARSVAGTLSGAAGATTSPEVTVVPMALWSVHWTDPDSVDGEVSVVGLQDEARAAKQRATAAYVSQTAPLRPDLQPVLPASVVSWPHEVVMTT